MTALMWLRRCACSTDDDAIERNDMTIERDRADSGHRRTVYQCSYGIFI